MKRFELKEMKYGEDIMSLSVWFYFLPTMGKQVDVSLILLHFPEEDNGRLIL